MGGLPSVGAFAYVASQCREQAARGDLSASEREAWGGVGRFLLSMTSGRGGVSAEAVKRRVGQAIRGYACGCERPWPPNGSYDELAGAVLESLGSFDMLAWIAERLLDLHYPSDLPLVCDRNSPDPGPRLAAAVRDCLEARGGE